MLRTTLAAVAVSLPLALLAAPAASAHPHDVLPHPANPTQQHPTTSGRQGSWVWSDWGSYPHTGTNAYGGYQNPHHRVVQPKPFR